MSSRTEEENEGDKEKEGEKEGGVDKEGEGEGNKEIDRERERDRDRGSYSHREGNESRSSMEDLVTSYFTIINTSRRSSPLVTISKHHSPGRSHSGHIQHRSMSGNQSKESVQSGSGSGSGKAGGGIDNRWPRHSIVLDRSPTPRPASPPFVTVHPLALPALLRMETDMGETVTSTATVTATAVDTDTVISQSALLLSSRDGTDREGGRDREGEGEGGSSRPLIQPSAQYSNVIQGQGDGDGDGDGCVELGEIGREKEREDVRGAGGGEGGGEGEKERGERVSDDLNGVKGEDTERSLDQEQEQEQERKEPEKWSPMVQLSLSPMPVSE